MLQCMMHVCRMYVTCMLHVVRIARVARMFQLDNDHNELSHSGPELGWSTCTHAYATMSVPMSIRSVYLYACLPACPCMCPYKCVYTCVYNCVHAWPYKMLNTCLNACLSHMSVPYCRMLENDGCELSYAGWNVQVDAASMRAISGLQ